MRWPDGGLPHGEHPYDYGYDDEPLERHDLVGEQGPGFPDTEADDIVEPRCTRCGMRLRDNGACPVHGGPCAHTDTLVRREPPSWAPTPWPAVLITECEECGETLSTLFVEAPTEREEGR